MVAPEITAALQSEGLKPVRIKHRAQYLRRYGFRPDIVVDVGVYRGTDWLYSAYGDADFLLVDPLAETEALVAARAPADYEFLPVALGEAEGELVLNVPRTKTGGGNLAGFHARIDVSRTWYSEAEPRVVPVRTLDAVMRDRPGSVGLKIDTEGHEVAVLAGAKETLKRCLFVVAEVSVSRRFADTPLPSALIARLAAAGLELRDVIDMAPPEGDLPRHMDLLFTRWADAQEGAA
ncbi:FkbM family methyltransferase [Pseudoruegeria sp. HB172150]|uniref:FkbM family methyltransferase n=1 Tax=Pseudoruegeria sp. HB172150 TaxID=2721164 RepID=UPI001555D7A9|nr:FkbM family methyltransferase [Pseudoruegeria sp. HB172150]